MCVRFRPGRVLGTTLTFGVVVPLSVLGGLYGVSVLTGVAFGDFVFGLTAAVAVGVLLFSGVGRRLDAARPKSELFRKSATAHVREQSATGADGRSVPTRFVLVVAGTVVLGWLVVIAFFVR